MFGLDQLKNLKPTHMLLIGAVVAAIAYYFYAYGFAGLSAGDGAVGGTVGAGAGVGTAGVDASVSVNVDYDPRSDKSDKYAEASSASGPEASCASGACGI